VGAGGVAGLAEVCPGIETWDRGSLDDWEQIVRPHLDPGSFFLAYRRDPRTAFVPIQLSLARNDAMMDISDTPARRSGRARQQANVQTPTIASIR
jgi:hypothetical protein